MTTTMVRGGPVGNRRRAEPVEVGAAQRLRTARLGIQLHQVPTRRWFGLGPLICSMCDQRWHRREAELHGCRGRAESLADFLELATVADLEWALAKQLISPTEATRSKAWPSMPPAAPSVGSVRQ